MPDIPVSTLADWVAPGAEASVPVAQEIRRRLLESGVVQVDATPLTVLDLDKPWVPKRCFHRPGPLLGQAPGNSAPSTFLKTEWKYRNAAFHNCHGPPTKPKQRRTTVRFQEWNSDLWNLRATFASACALLCVLPSAWTPCKSQDLR